jgi:hypothetical protein
MPFSEKWSSRNIVSSFKEEEQEEEEEKREEREKQTRDR